MNYPGKIKKNNCIKIINYGNRGLGLEDDINASNSYYLEIGKAIIHKKPTPIKVVNVNYHNKPKITEAYFEKPSTTDYNGIYKGFYIDFEAKETSSKTSFNICNIHEHQIEHLKNVHNQKGIAFLLVRFVKHNQTFFLKIEDLLSFMENNTKRSIPYDYFLEKGFIIKNKLKPMIDYLEIIDNYVLEVKS